LSDQAASRRISIVIPFFNEEESVRPLLDRIAEALQSTGVDYEVVAVDDGSRDRTFDELRAARDRDARVRVVRLRRNYGQTPAMAAGFEACRGDVVITMDGDLQNDPMDIPMLVGKLDDGFDFVCGWRKKRQDRWLSRKLPSRIANWLIGRITGVRVHDYGCSLKAYRASVVKGMHLYSDMHRFLPAMANMAGARITEVVVDHHPRRFGKSKYGISRTMKVLLDLLVVKMIMGFSSRPVHWFGILSLPFLFLGLVALAIGLQGNVNVSSVAVLLLFLFFQFMALGLLGELVVKSGDHHIKDLALRVEEER
jgi:glycosyltransferase involved in cell wall biosynthesis